MSEQDYQNRIERLEKQLALAKDTIRVLTEDLFPSEPLTIEDMKRIKAEAMANPVSIKQVVADLKAGLR